MFRASTVLGFASNISYVNSGRLGMTASWVLRGKPMLKKRVHSDSSVHHFTRCFSSAMTEGTQEKLICQFRRDGVRYRMLAVMVYILCNC